MQDLFRICGEPEFSHSTGTGVCSTRYVVHHWYRVDDALQGLEPIVDGEDVILTVCNG